MKKEKEKRNSHATCICLLSSIYPPGNLGLLARQTNSLPSSSASTFNDIILYERVSDSALYIKKIKS